jgi:hypothetical protein
MTTRCIFFLVLAMALITRTATAQVIDTPIVYFQHDPKVVVKDTFLIKGRVIGFNLEDIGAASVTNMCTGEGTTTNKRGMYQIRAVKNDTVVFQFARHSLEYREAKRSKENLNIILIRRKTEELPVGYSRSDYNKARKADEEFYRILEKDAKLEGRWIY